LGSGSTAFGAQQGFSIIWRNILGLSPVLRAFKMCGMTWLPPAISRPHVVGLGNNRQPIFLPKRFPAQLPPTKLAEIYSNPNS
jgi:hypothetical protein